MATIPSPRTWTVGELLTAAKLNTDLRDSLNFLLAKPFCHLARQSGFNSQNTGIQWDLEYADTDNGHSTSTNPERYTSQTAGWYHIVLNVEPVNAFDNNTWQRGRIGGVGSDGFGLLNCDSSTAIFRNSSSAGIDTTISVSGYMPLAVGAYCFAEWFASAEELVSNSTFMMITWVRTLTS